MGSVLFIIDPNAAYLLEKMAGTLYHMGKPAIEVMDTHEDSAGFSISGKTATLSENSGPYRVACDAFFTNKDKLQEKINSFNNNSYSNIKEADLVAKLYSQYGLTVVNHLQGAFSFILWDDFKKRLILARDKWGLRPLFYSQNGKYFAAASNIKTLLQLPWMSREPNPIALQSILLSQTNYFSETFFRGIFKLNPGSLLIFKDGNIENHTYRNINWSIDKSFDAKSAVQKLRALLSNAVNNWTSDNCKYAALLSGGLDSSSIVALFTNNKKYPIDTFTTGHSFDDPEVIFAAKVAAEFGSNNFFSPVTAQDIPHVLHEIAWFFEEPFGLLNIVPLFLALRRIKVEHDAVLLGDTADGLFAGSLRHKVLLPWIPLPKFIKREFYKNSFLSMPPSTRISKFLQSIYWNKEQFSRPLLENPKYFKEYLEKMELFLKNNTGSLLNNMLKFEIENELPNFVNAITNRLCEANRVDARVPFVDDNLIQFAVRLPDHYKIRIWKEKWILRQAMKDLLPIYIYKRPKFGQRFEYDQILTETLELLANQFLKDNRFRKRGLFDLRTIQSSLNRRTGVPYYSKQAHQIWTLIFIEIVTRIFLDAKETCCPENLQDLM